MILAIMLTLLPSAVLASGNPCNYTGAFLAQVSYDKNNNPTGAKLSSQSLSKDAVPVMPTIAVTFDKNVVDNATVQTNGKTTWVNNQTCFNMQDSLGKDVPINAFRIDDMLYSAFKQDIFVQPLAALEAGGSYSLLVTPDLIAKTGTFLAGTTDGKGATITFTVAASIPSLDKVGPVITLIGSPAVDVTLGADYNDAGATALDDLDGDISSSIVVGGGSVNTNLAGTYVITYNVSDKAGNKATEAKRTVVVASALTAGLKDVAGHWAETYIYQLVAKGAVGGYPDGSFLPDTNISRAEFVTILVKAFGLEMKSGKVFDDTVNSWAKEYVATATAYGITGGYSDNIFGTDDPITREQMAVMLVKAAQLSDNGVGKTFADGATISNWAQDAVKVVTAHQIMSGYENNTFRPQNNASRAEAVTVIVLSLK